MGIEKQTGWQSGTKHAWEKSFTVAICQTCQKPKKLKHKLASGKIT